MMIIPGTSVFNKFGRKGVLAALGVGLVFFAMASALAPGNQKKFSSPDETANYLLIRSVADGDGLALASPLTSAGGIVGPRSMVKADGELLPGSFLGIVLLYGSIAGIIGSWSIPFLTPLFSSIALVCLFFGFRKFFREDIALLSTILVAVHPAFWYYSSRGMYHNVLAVDSAIIGFFFLLHASFRRSSRRVSLLWYAISGIALGCAVAVRTSEAAWIGAVAVILLIAQRRTVDWRIGFGTLLLGAVVPMAVIFGVNSNVYGQPLTFGYSRETIATSSVASVAAGLGSKIADLFFPFGIHPREIAVNFWNYGIKLFWLPSILSLYGALALLRKNGNRAERFYLLVYCIVGAWLLAYYGSWNIQDSPDPNAVTIGTSYVRYWLPIYVLAMPFTAYAIDSIAANVGRSRRIVAIGIFVAVILSSIMLTVLDKDEGLATMRRATIEYRRLGQKAASMTPAGSVVITGSGDKIFFPERSVVVDVATPQQEYGLRTLLMNAPVYVYVPAAESPTAAKQQWNARGFELTDQINLAAYERLFKLVDLRKPH